MPKVKDDIDIKKPELSKDVEIKEKPKTESDVPEKNETLKLKPEFDIIEREASKVTPKNDTSKLQPDFEIIEREASEVTPEGDASKSKPEAESKEKGTSKIAPEKDTSKLKPEVEIKEKEPPKVDPGTAKNVVKIPENVVAHVKTEDDEIKVGAKSPVVADTKHAPTGTLSDADGKSGDRETNAQFVVLEKGEAVTPKNADGLKKTDHAIDSFLSGEQKHSGRLEGPESIQDQQL